MAVPWRSWRPGTRVVVRYRRPGGGAADALGDVLRVQTDGPEAGLEVRTRRGPVWVPAETILLGKTVPPPPPPRRSRR